MIDTQSQVRPETTPRRARILDETLRIVSERGYHGFGIQELAERCGLTKPGLLHHFGSRGELLLAISMTRLPQPSAALRSGARPRQPSAHRSA